MSRRLVIDPEAREYIEAKIEADGVVTVDEVRQIIHPYYQFDPVLSRERKEKVYARRLLAKRRDLNGVRTCFATKDPEHPEEYVDIEHTTDLRKLDGVIKQLVARRSGLDAPIRKAMRKRKQIVGQISFKDYKTGTASQPDDHI
jgi:hypothetical protein